MQLNEANQLLDNFYSPIRNRVGEAGFQRHPYNCPHTYERCRTGNEGMSRSVLNYVGPTLPE